jgi:capsular exopolysaccharide synthesis family protein
MKPSKDLKADQEQSSVFRRMVYKYLPFWYIFLILFLVAGALAFAYLKVTTPLYESYASILIKDEKRGQEESQMEEVLNLFSQKNIVENEVEIIRSNAVLQETVSRLGLYAPIWEEYGWQRRLTASAYHSSPVRIQLRDSVNWKNTNKIEIAFTRDGVWMKGKTYKIGSWFQSPWGEMRFVKNPEFWNGYRKKGSKFYFKLIKTNKAASMLASRLVVSPTSKQASVVALKLRDEVPERGETILSEIVNVYNLTTIRKKNETAYNTLRFIEERLGKVTKELDSVEQSIQQYRDNSGIVDISQQSSQYLRSVEQNDMELNKTKVQMAVIDEVDSYLNSNTGRPIAPSTFNIQDQTLSQLLDRLYTKELELEKLSSTTAENNPIILSLRGEVDRLRDKINENIANQRKSLQASESHLSSVSGQYNSMLNTIPKKEKELVEVSRQRNIKSDIYSFLLQKKEEATYALKSSVAESHLVQLPASSSQPVSPKKPFIGVLAFLVPLVFGVGLVGARDFLSSRVLYRDDIHSLTNVPVIGEVILDKDERDILSKAGGRSFVQEQFRQIRTSFRNLAMNKGTYRRVMVTSSIEGEGKSFVAANFAISIARTGKKVVLVGCDLYQPVLQDIFDLDAGKGVTDYLLGEAEPREILIPTSIDNLTLVSSGNLVRTPSELITNGRIEILLNYLDALYDLVIIDSPPVRPVSDAYELAQYCNFVLFVVRHDFTPKVSLQILDEDMENHNISDMAIVFNGVKKRGLGKYSYGYGYGYGYDDRASYDEYGKGKKKRKIA